MYMPIFFHFLGIEHESASQRHDLGDEPFFLFVFDWNTLLCTIVLYFNLNNNKYCVCFH